MAGSDSRRTASARRDSQCLGIAYRSRPSAFFRTDADERIREALGLTAPVLLYGRRNTLFDTEGLPLADILEILPPFPLRPADTP